VERSASQAKEKDKSPVFPFHPADLFDEEKKSPPEKSEQLALLNKQVHLAH
jgi:hypothetical protein